MAFKDIFRNIKQLKNKDKPILMPTKKKKNKENKERIILMILLLSAGAIFSYTQLNANTDKVQDNHMAAGEMVKASNKNPANNAAAKKMYTVDLLSIPSPFVENEGYRNEEDMPANRKIAANTSGNMPAVPSYPQSYDRNYSSSSQGLPPIPNIPSGSPSLPIIPAPAQAQIQGILSDESGNKLAIVDGQTLKEGDTLNGRGISAITNNGIVFDNGDSISYNIAN